MLLSESNAVADGVIEIDPFDIVTEIARISASGTVALEQEIDVKLAVSFPRDLFSREGVSEEVLDALTDREQWLTIPLAITGTPQNPRFGPDMDVVAEATRFLAEQAKESLTRRAREELTGFVGRRLGGGE